MHEQAMFRDLLRKVTEVAQAEGAPHITRIRLWVGALSHLTAAHLQADWAPMTQGTVAEGAGLEVTVSSDLNDPRAQGVVLMSLDVGAREPAPPPGTPGA